MSNKIIIALGADMKNRFLLARGERFYFGPDIGDLNNAKNYEYFEREVHKVLKKVKPDIIAYDLHPGYFSTLFAKEWSRLLNIDCQMPIQHHYAHIASVLEEHKVKRPIIGIAFDGTGYGTDGNIWGGEFLLADKHGFKRLAHFKYRMMPGAEKVIYEPWRMVLSVIGRVGADFINDVNDEEKEIIFAMMKKDINSPLTSSAGRLFDAAAALIGICSRSSYEAEGPTRLEGLCQRDIKETYDFDIKNEGDTYIIDTDKIFLGMARDIRKGKDKTIAATKFHNSIAEIIINTAKRLSKGTCIKEIVLSGGVFQNKFLKEISIRRLDKIGFNIFTNNKTPVSDLNISLGQYYVSCNTCKN